MILLLLLHFVLSIYVVELFLVSLLLLISEETYPSEATRADLSEKLDLSDRQLQMWFCHRRLKDKKDGQSKKPAKSAVQSSALASSVHEIPPAGSVPEQDSRSDSGSESGCSPYSNSRRNFASGSSSSRAELDEYDTMGKASYESRLSTMVRRAIVCIEAQLGEPLRDDGPILGMEFDPLPPGAFGTPIGIHYFLCLPCFMTCITNGILDVSVSITILVISNSLTLFSLSLQGCRNT